MRRWMVVIGIGLGVMGSGCVRASDASERTAAPTAAQLARVVARAVAQRVEVDNPFDEPDSFDQVYVIDREGRSAGWGMVQFEDGDAALSQTVHAAVSDALAPVDVAWVDEVGTVADGERVTVLPAPRSAVVKLAAPRIVDGHVLIAVELYCGPDCGIGGTYEFGPAAEGWPLLGTVGPGFVA